MNPLLLYRTCTAVDPLRRAGKPKYRAAGIEFSQASTRRIRRSVPVCYIDRMLRCWLTTLICFGAFAAEPAIDWKAVHAEALKHFQSVVRIDSTNPPGNETKVVNYVKSVLDREGIPNQVFTLDEGRGNLVARLKGN